MRPSVPVALLLLLAGCNDSGTTSPPPAPDVGIVSGNGQTGAVGEPLSSSLVVRVADRDGAPAAGVPITWSTDAGQGSIAGDARTDAQGRAEAIWTLGTSMGAQQAMASAEGIGSATFGATARPGPAAVVTLSADTVPLDHHGGTATLSAVAEDAYGNAVATGGLQWVSADTLVARVGPDGTVEGRQPGETVVRAELDGVAGEASARVHLQANPSCSVPGSAPARGPVGPLPSFAGAGGYFDVRPPRYDMAEPAVADFDGDGLEDLILMSSNFPPNPDLGEVLYWRNTGSGYVDATLEVLGTDTIRAWHTRQVEVRDLNGDGLPDVFAVQHGYDSSPDGAPELLFITQGDGTMKEVARERLDPYETGNYSHASAAGDADCDGDVDLFAGSGGGGGRQTNHLYVNDGAGHFTAEDDRMPADAADPSKIQVTAALFCDLDVDGDQDLLMGGSHKNPSAILLNDGFGGFRHAEEPSLPASIYGADGNILDAKCVDVNGNGLPDLLLSDAGYHYSPAHVRLWINQGNLVFRDVTDEWIPNETTDGFIWRITVRDFNADGWPDFHLGYSGAGGYSPIYVNQRGTEFSVVDPGATYVFPIDADGDGRPDLVWSGAVSDTGEEYSPGVWFNQ